MIISSNNAFFGLQGTLLLSLPLLHLLTMSFNLSNLKIMVDMKSSLAIMRVHYAYVKKLPTAIDLVQLLDRLGIPIIIEQAGPQ